MSLSQRNFQTEWGSAVMIDREVKEVKEEPAHAVPNVAAEPSDYVMKEGEDGEKES